MEEKIVKEENKEEGEMVVRVREWVHEGKRKVETEMARKSRRKRGR